MQPVQTQYMQNLMQNTNMTNNRLVCDQDVPQAMYMGYLQSGAPVTNIGRLCKREGQKKTFSFHY